MPRSKLVMLALVLVAALPSLAVRWAVAQAPNLRGRVISTDGKPVAGADVELQGTTLSTRSGADGGFEFTGAPAGGTTLTFRRIGYLPTIAIVTIPDTSEFEVTLVASSPELDTVKVIAHMNVLAGVVVDSVYRGLPGVTVDMVGASQHTATDAAGRFTLTAVRSGTVVLRLRKLGFAPVTRSVRLDAWRGLLVRMNGLPNTLSEGQLRDRSGFGAREFYWREASERITVKGTRAAIVSREELAEWGGSSLLSAVLHAPSAAFVASDVQAAGMRACILQDGWRAVGPASLDAFRADDIEFVEIYPAGTELTSSVARNLSTVRCPPVGTLGGLRRGPLYVVIWMRTQ